MQVKCPKCTRDISLDLGELFDFHLEFSCFKCNGQLVFSSRTEKLKIFTDEEYRQTEKKGRMSNLIKETKKALDNKLPAPSLDARLKIDQRSVEDIVGKGAKPDAGGTGIDLKKYQDPKSKIFDWKKAMKDFVGEKKDHKEFLPFKRQLEYMMDFNYQAYILIGKRCQELYSASSRQDDFETFQNQMVESYKNASQEKEMMDNLKSMTSAELFNFARLL